MTYSARVVADSITDQGVRLTTVEVTMPRIVLAEQNTHRVFSRNTASSRAIPVKTRCDSIEQNPFVPAAFGKNQKGMQATEMLDHDLNMQADAIWREALADALKHARRLAEIGVHKQYANRLTEPFSWVTQLVTATDWDNYFNLRCHKDAQPEIRIAAELTRDAIKQSFPAHRKLGQWHLPLVDEDIADVMVATKVSVARCAAVSYEKHGVVKTVEEELTRHDMMLASGHMSPFEHQAFVGPYTPNSFTGNFRSPWVQYRKMLPGEAVFKDDK
jgi:thymidylate synthase ThyX